MRSADNEAEQAERCAQSGAPSVAAVEEVAPARCELGSGEEAKLWRSFRSRMKMRKTLLIAALLPLASIAKAQERPRVEIFGGYSLLRADGGGNLSGWNASAAANLNRWLGLVADFGGNYGSQSVRLRIQTPRMNFIDARASSNVHTFLAGPQVSYPRYERFKPFARALLGAARTHVDGRFSTEEFSLAFSATDTGFAMALGGGLDAKLGGRVWLRPIQVDYLLTRFRGDTQNNARISFGFVFRFGTR